MFLQPIKAIIKERFPVVHRKLLRWLGKNPDLWRTVLERINAASSNVSFVEIGAMDGVSFDLLHGFATKYAWRGLVVEPLPDYFENLKKNYKNNPHIRFENTAISTTAGFATLYRVDPDAIRHGHLPDWWGGVSSLYKDRNALNGKGSSTGEFEKVKRYIREVQVRTMTVDELFEKHDIRAFDILQIDTEGHDVVILKQIDLKKYRPQAIMIEWINLLGEEKRYALKVFKSHGYCTRIVGQDIIAYQKSLSA